MIHNQPIQGSRMANAVSASLAESAQELLRALAGEQATLRDDHLAAIQALVVDRRRAVVVKRTGWGKSAVYFLATRLLRDQGAGPTLLVSPLLSLMRDQIAKAEAIGIRAATINSTNLDQWRQVEAELAAGQVDLLLISPERHNNPQFRTDVLPDLARQVGLLVIDEAHCISDWLRRESRFQRVDRTPSGPRTKGRRLILPPRHGRVVPSPVRSLVPPRPCSSGDTQSPH